MNMDSFIQTLSDDMNFFILDSSTHKSRSIYTVNISYAFSSAIDVGWEDKSSMDYVLRESRDEHIKSSVMSSQRKFVDKFDV